MSTTDQEIIPKPGTKSEVWQYFGLLKGPNGQAIDDGSAYCKLCRKKVLAKSGNTSNLKAHLKNNHKTVHCQLQKPSAPIIPKVRMPAITPLTQALPYGHQNKRYKELNEAVAYFICKDGLPIYTVEKPGFRSMIKKLDSRYEIPSRAHFSRSIIPDLYTSTKQKVTQEIAGLKFFAATTDMWSSIGMIPYMSFTLHFINEEWQLKSFVLSTSYLPKNHTAEVLAEALEEVMSEWTLNSDCLVSLTTDSGSNIVAAARKLHWTRLSCFGHNLNLAITKALSKDKRCDRALGHVRKLVSAFSYSWKRRRDLTQAQITLDIPQHRLISVSKYLICVCMQKLTM